MMPLHTHENVQIVKLIKGDSQKVQDTVVTELPFSIWMNGNMLATIICTPSHLDELAAGFLLAERIIDGMEEISSLKIDEARGAARVEVEGTPSSFNKKDTPRFITPGCLFGTSSLSGLDKIESPLHVESHQVFDLMTKASAMSHLYRSTGGVHSAALCSPHNIVVFREDIGRHNAIDKVIGHCVLKGSNPAGHLLITSGRISSAVMGKIINAHIPIMVSSSAPTLEAVKLSETFGVTLVGFARGRRMNVYAGEDRITDLN
jgi:FdhD protein